MKGVQRDFAVTTQYRLRKLPRAKVKSYKLEELAATDGFDHHLRVADLCHSD